MHRCTAPGGAELWHIGRPISVLGELRSPHAVRQVDAHLPSHQLVHAHAQDTAFDVAEMAMQGVLQQLNGEY